MPCALIHSSASAVLLGLATAHLAADFVLQTDEDVRLKRQFRVGPFAKHGLMHAAAASCLSGLWSSWQIPAVLFVVHPLVDLGKEAAMRWLASRGQDGVIPVRWILGAFIGTMLSFAWGLVATWLTQYALQSV